MRSQTILVDTNAEIGQFENSIKSLNRAAIEFGKVFSGAMKESVRSGRSFEGTLKAIGKRLADMALKSALRPLDQLFEGMMGSLGTYLGGNQPQLGRSVVPFAKGGVVSSPYAFPMNGQLGLIGEAGSEAVMPLARGSDGRLGILASGSHPQPVNVVFNVHTNDAESFRKTEPQLTALLARAVQRGKRGL